MFAIFLTFRGGVHLPRRKVDLGGGGGVHFTQVGGGGIYYGEKWTGGGGGGSILYSEKGPGVTFAIFLTFRGGGHFQRVKIDRGVHFQRLKMDRGSIFNG